MYGPDRLQSELSALGYETRRVVVEGVEYVIIEKYEVDAGRFAGRIVDLGLPVPPNFPLAVGSAIHVCAEPQLLDYSNIPNVRNIIESKLGPTWRYWSINFHWSGECERSAARLMHKINRIFADA